MEEELNQENELGFWDHVEELRKRIIYAVLGIVVGCIIAGIFIDDIMNLILLQPATNAKLDLQNLKPFGQPFLYFKVILVVGIIISSPFILYQLWAFIKPALYEHEKKWVSTITFFTTLCFFAGVIFSYFVMIPSMLSFAASFGSEKIKNIIDINEYFSFLTMILLASGILFEMPMITFVLARFGIVTPKMLRKYRRHSIVLILIIAAVVTPTPDPISQLIFAAPLFLLYEVSILIAVFGVKKRAIAEQLRNEQAQNA
jgi:sec-independent protein translocase protein TatC